MLKPDAIRDKEFEQSVLGGYRREEVDNFLDELERDYRKLYTENEEMLEKLQACLAKIENYRKDEEFLKTAIINAQRLNETTVKEIEMREKEAELASREKAAKIIADAESYAKEIIKKAEIESADAVKSAREACRTEIEAEQEKADSVIRGIRRDTEKEQKKLDSLKNQVSAFRVKIMEIYKEHLTSISKLPEFKPAPAQQPEEPAPAPEEKAEPAPVPQPAPVQPVQTPAAPVESEEPADAENGSTVEFKLSEKHAPKAPEDTHGGRQLKFENLKFGVDYDINQEQ